MVAQVKATQQKENGFGFTHVTTKKKLCNWTKNYFFGYFTNQNYDNEIIL